MKKLLLILMILPILSEAQTYTGDKFNARVSIKSPIYYVGSLQTQPFFKDLGNAKFSRKLLLGATADTTDFPLGYFISSNGNTTHTYPHPVAVVGESIAADSPGYTATGVGGVARTDGQGIARGVVGVGKVKATGDTGASIGIWGRAIDTHAGGANIGVYASATGGADNYSFYGASGVMYNSTHYLKGTDTLISKLDTATLYRNGALSKWGFAKILAGGGTTYTAGNRIGISGTTIYNKSYWKDQDTVKTTLTGILKATSGLLSVASAGTDYQAPLTNPVTGTGTANYVSYWNGTNTIAGDSDFQFDGTNVAIGTTPGTYKLNVSGNINSNGTISSLILSGGSYVTTSGYLISARTTTTALTSGIYCQAAAAATAGIPVRITPYLIFDGKSWNTTTLASNSNQMGVALIPQSGNPTSAYLKIQNIYINNEDETTEHVRIYSNGNIGFSPSLIPQSKLHVDGGTATASNLQFTANATTGQTATDGVCIGIGTDAKAIWRNYENTSNEIYTNNTLATTIDASQNLTQVGRLTGLGFKIDSATVRLGVGAGWAKALTNQNVFIGDSAGYSTTATSSEWNVAIGYAAGRRMRSSSTNNTVVGWKAGYDMNDGVDNSLFGTQAGWNITTGSDNTILGYGAGLDLTTGSNNIFIGKNSARKATTQSNRFSVNAITKSTIAADSTEGLMWGYMNTTVGNQKLYVNAKAVVTNDLSYEVRHGFYDKSADYTPSVTQNVYTKILPTFTNSESSNITFAGDSITIVTAGDYYFMYTVTLNGANSEDFTIQLRKNNTAVKSLRQTTSGATNYHSVPLQWYFADLVAGDDISLWVTNTASNNDPTLSSQDIYIRKEHD